MRRPAAVATALVFAAAAFSLAAPASADHIVVVTQSGCSVGPFTARFPGGFPYDMTTDVVDRSRVGDVVRTRCTFTGLPRGYYNEDLDVQWTRVSRLTSVPVNMCVLGLGDPADDGAYVEGQGTATFTRSGTARVECVFTLPPGA